jgi:glycosyltransferase involved in cell wall biosynthesis
MINDPVKRIGCGIHVNAGSAYEIANSIIDLYLMPEEERQIMGANGKSYLMKNLTYDSISANYLNLINV